MASHKSITVLTPNGRRQAVPVTPNTTLLQVLEQACSKHGFNPHEFDLRHHNKIMDVDNVIRFTGLPNNALLEMVPTKKIRKDSEVILGVQIETGERFTGSFMPTDTLLAVLNKLCPDEVSKEGNPVVIYMRTEVSGQSLLQHTNLRSLGITGGRAMLRFIHRSPESLRTQANVSTPLPRPVSKHKIDFEEEKKSEGSGTVDKHNDVKEVIPKVTLPRDAEAEAISTKEPPAIQEPSPKEDQEEKEQEIEKMDEEVVPEKKEEAPGVLPPVESKVETISTNEEEPMDTTDSKKKDVQIASGSMQETPPVEEEIKLLPGDRSGCVFSMNRPLCSSAKGMDHDLPDDFFQVTLEDARVMLRDLKRRREELEDAPLLTSAARRQNEAHFLVMPCVIRIMFPNRTVLQGCFVGGETVKDIKSFVSENLEESSRPFHLYLAPPKVVLKPECLLYEVDGFPAVLLYFAYDMADSSTDDNVTSLKDEYLQSSVLTNLISQECANRVAHRARGLPYRSQGSTSHKTSDASTMSNPTSLPSTSKKSMSREASSRGCGPSPRPVNQNSTEKVPKWFR
ncbi:tether containing UBX domain for GLUT4 [Hetaerina americana]|uniref:tether containing UBX domain for GLUT4 n=1 Tax=Hetaerina americana TaxID=62018 RepID=UPI003A7F4BF9